MLTNQQANQIRRPQANKAAAPLSDHVAVRTIPRGPGATGNNPIPWRPPVCARTRDLDRSRGRLANPPPPGSVGGISRPHRPVTDDQARRSSLRCVRDDAAIGLILHRMDGHHHMLKHLPFFQPWHLSTPVGPFWLLLETESADR